MTPVKTERKGKEVFIPLLPQLQAELDSIARYDDYVLPDLVASYNRDRSEVSRRMRKVFDAAGLAAHKDLNLTGQKAIVETGAHSLRHSFITIARLAGVPDTIIKQITAHQTIQMTDHYDQSFNEETVSKLADGLHMPELSGGGRIPVPAWVMEKLRAMNSDNWESIRCELVEGMTDHKKSQDHHLRRVR
ncbi:tyrosine-type recombinase/integrase [Pontiella agarivorans]|uniref:Tyrosine-type recombinase/integrase n=1 Tax=Pontiella agarivorans TaxID=3038953 RepID=A0ABU5N1E3_9BACT|nr:tyrosine-type recombinase/integrase [Pontiella agarivorans]MDZ8120229.1 tyrosine-type recombinase/integrase [Pontiella agarivorans]